MNSITDRNLISRHKGVSIGYHDLKECRSSESGYHKECETTALPNARVGRVIGSVSVVDAEVWV